LEHLQNPRSTRMMHVIQHRGEAKLLRRKHLPVFHKRQASGSAVLRCRMVFGEESLRTIHANTLPKPSRPKTLNLLRKCPAFCFAET